MQDGAAPASRLDRLVQGNENINYRLQATLNQLNFLEESLIGSPPCDTCKAASGAANAALITLLEIEQDKTTSLLDEIGYVLDRVTEAVRK